MKRKLESLRSQRNPKKMNKLTKFELGGTMAESEVRNQRTEAR